MPEKTRRSSSVFGDYSKPKNEDLFHKKVYLSGRQLTIGIIFGVFLTIVTIALQCIAFFTPHWKEISPNTHSLYVDGVDALIRTETLIYFNSVHRFTRHSYGLFQRCEYLLHNSSKFVHQQQEIPNNGFNRQQKRCTKNFLPSFEDEQFNECHSLEYYRFCSKTGEKIFDINNDYLRATFDILSNPSRNIDSTSSCDCRYPKYVKACHVLGIFALIFLFLTALLFGSFPFLRNRHQRLKIKCFGVLSSIFSMLFIIINISVVLNFLEYESIEYLNAIERHYRSSQIYKLSQDTSVAINRFRSSINITSGYSTKIAWIAFVLSIIDGILLMFTCKLTSNPDDTPFIFTGISMNSSEQGDKIENEEYQTSTVPLTSTRNTTDSQLLLPPPPPPAPLPPTIVINNFDEQPKIRSSPLTSCLKQSSSSPRVSFENEV
jgi:hypothetical protein